MAIKDKTNWQRVDQEFRHEIETMLQKAVFFLAKVGEVACAYARENGSYTDRTGNLRHSIGYLVIQNGQVMVDGFGTTDPQQSARQYAYQVAQAYKKNTVLIWVAGMSYAKYVEAKGFDVLQGSGDFIESKARTLAKEFEQFLLQP